MHHSRLGAVENTSVGPRTPQPVAWMSSQTLTGTSVVGGESHVQVLAGRETAYTPEMDRTASNGHSMPTQLASEYHVTLGRISFG